MKIIKRILSSAFGMVLAVILACTISYNSMNRNWHNKVIESLSACGDEFYTDGTCSQSTINDMKDFLSELPQSIQDSFDIGGWAFCVGKNIPTDTFYSGFAKGSVSTSPNSQYFLSGITVVLPRIVYINSASGDYQSYETFIHEIGHAVSYMYGNVHASREFVNYYNKYGSSDTFTEYERSSEAEFFASSFEKYFTCRQTLEDEMPEVAEYIKSIINTEVPDENILIKAKTATTGSFRGIIMNIEQVLKNVSQ